MKQSGLQMCLASLRVQMFWNIARHFAGDFAACLRQVVPAQEVDKLLERSRELSEKVRGPKKLCAVSLVSSERLFNSLQWRAQQVSSSFPVARPE